MHSGGRWTGLAAACLAVAALAVAAGATGATRAAGAAGPRVSLAWQGIDADRVGASESAKPDSALDGHFTLTIDAGSKPLAIRSLEVRLTDRAGTAEGSQYWDTIPGNGVWVLGVYRKGTLLDPDGRTFAPTVSGRTTYELYAANSGYFTEGAFYKVKVAPAKGKVLTALTSIHQSRTSLSATWQGMTQDVVGNYSVTGPNGVKDVHFQLRLTVTGASRTITDIRIDSANAGGTPDGVAIWNNVPDTIWIDAVYDGGRRLNPTDTPLSESVSGTRVFDLYGNPASTTPLAAGTTYRITVTFADGSASTVTTI